MRKPIYIILFLLCAFPLGAQDVRTLFDSIPGHLLPLLSPVNRADFIDFMDSRMKAEVKNKFDGTSEMTHLTENYIRIQLTAFTSWEMKMLPLNDTTKIICVVQTACAPVCDSNVAFYSAEWKELPVSDFIELPVLDDFFQLTDSARLDDYLLFRQQMDMLLATATLSPDENTLVFTLTTPQYVSYGTTEEERGIPDTELFLRKPLIYVWRNNPATGIHYFMKNN